MRQDLWKIRAVCCARPIFQVDCSISDNNRPAGSVEVNDLELVGEVFNDHGLLLRCAVESGNIASHDLADAAGKGMTCLAAGKSSVIEVEPLLTGWLPAW